MKKGNRDMQALPRAYI